MADKDLLQKLNIKIDYIEATKIGTKEKLQEVIKSYLKWNSIGSLLTGVGFLVTFDGTSRESAYNVILQGAVGFCIFSSGLVLKEYNRKKLEDIILSLIDHYVKD